jgi:hypothetical protein
MNRPGFIGEACKIPGAVQTCHWRTAGNGPSARVGRCKLTLPPPGVAAACGVRNGLI